METRQLRSALRTGHHANIFCTRYMPGTGGLHHAYLHPAMQPASVAAAMQNHTVQLHGKSLSSQGSYESGARERQLFLASVHGKHGVSMC